MDFFSTNNILIHIPFGAGGYDLSWIEAIGALCGLLCIWLASLEKTINYLFGLINVSLFAVIFFQIQLYASLLLQIFFFVANVYGWYAWTRRTEQQDIALKIRWLPLPRLLVWSALGALAIWINDRLHRCDVCRADGGCDDGDAKHGRAGDHAHITARCLPLLGFQHDGALHDSHGPDDA